jgi:hypothetical protein
MGGGGLRVIAGEALDTLPQGQRSWQTWLCQGVAMVERREAAERGEALVKLPGGPARERLTGQRQRGRSEPVSCKPPGAVGWAGGSEARSQSQ